MSNTTSTVDVKTATVVEVRESLVLIEVDEQTPVMKNEVGYVCVGEERLKAEVLRIRGARQTCRYSRIPMACAWATGWK